MTESEARPHPEAEVNPPPTIRTDRRPGDFGRVVELHGRLYADEYGFDETFEADVAEPLAQYILSASPRERLWLAQREEQLVGCIAIVAATDEVAQLRWVLVDPSARGMGLGKRLLNAAVAFSSAAGYQSIILWTVSTLVTAGHLYRSVGFRKVEESRAHRWGRDVIEERHELALR